MAKKKYPSELQTTVMRVNRGSYEALKAMCDAASISIAEGFDSLLRTAESVNEVPKATLEDVPTNQLPMTLFRPDNKSKLSDVEREAVISDYLANLTPESWIQIAEDKKWNCMEPCTKCDGAQIVNKTETETKKVVYKVVVDNKPYNLPVEVKVNDSGKIETAYVSANKLTAKDYKVAYHINPETGEREIIRIFREVE